MVRTMKTRSVKKRRRKNPTRVCEYCNVKAARKVRLNHTFGRGARMVVVANVETIVCDNCGRSYLEGAALETVNQILSRPDAYAAMRQVAIADFSLA